MRMRCRLAYVGLFCVAFGITAAPWRVLSLEPLFNGDAGVSASLGSTGSPSPNTIAEAHSPTCLEQAHSIDEPYTAEYLPRTHLAEIVTEERLSVWGWNGNITKELFEQSAQNPHVTRYKIIDRKLYVDTRSPQSDHAKRVTVLEELLAVVVYLFPLPNMEFIVHYGDACFPNQPVITLCVCLENDNVGFSIPSHLDWLHALGPMQMRSYHNCLRERYPATKRKPLAVWRGTSTGIAMPVTPETCAKLARVQLHLLSRQHPDVLDARITQLVQRCGDMLAPLLNDTAPTPGHHIRFEDFNNYCAIIDLDGNTWSERYASHLVHFPTPILKMATNYSGFADGLFAGADTAAPFNSTFEDLLDRTRELVRDCVENGDFSEGQALALRSQGLARIRLGHMGVLRAAGYALANYRRLSNWTMDRSLEGFRQVMAVQPGAAEDPGGGTHAKLPKGMVAAIASHYEQQLLPGMGLGDGDGRQQALLAVGQGSRRQLRRRHLRRR